MVTLSAQDLNLLTAPELQPGPHACLSVADTGIGMNPNLADRIFDPYFTTKEQEKGTGLGLSVVHGIVKRYGGDIIFSSELGVGSKFTVYLPLCETDARREQKAPAVPAVIGAG